MSREFKRCSVVSKKTCHYDSLEVIFYHYSFISYRSMLR